MVEQRRDNAYYMQRLKKGWPALHRKVLNGKMTLAAARREAGLGGHRTRLHELNNAWSKATPAERSRFLLDAGPLSIASGNGASPCTDDCQSTVGPYCVDQ